MMRPLPVKDTTALSLALAITAGFDSTNLCHVRHLCYEAASIHLQGELLWAEDAES